LKTGFYTEEAVEQLTADKKNLHQEGKDAENDDTSREEDCKKPTEEGPTQENTLQHEKTEVSCVKIKAILQGKGRFIFLARMDF